MGVILSVLFAVCAFRMFRRQNEPGRLGGPIAHAKGFWLSYTIYTWFLFLPYLLLFKNPDPFFRDAYLFLTLSMWIRGVIEIYMLFVSKNWTPPIGVSHDIITLVGIILFPVLRQGLPPKESPHFIFYCSLILSLTVEIYYAYAFFKLMKERTKGKSGIWYASKEDPVFRKILRITTFFNVILYLILLHFTCVSLN